MVMKIENQKPAEASASAQPDVQSMIALFQEGKLDQLVALGESISDASENAHVMFNVLGAAQTTLGAYDAALESYTRSLKIRPDYAEAHNNLGNMWVTSGDADKAVAEFKEALRLKPEYADAYSNLGKTLQAIGEIDESLKSFQSALALRPDHPETLNHLGNVFVQTGDRASALKYYDHAISIKPDDIDVHKNISAIRKYQPDDPQIAMMQDLLTSPDRSDKERILLNFSLGKAFEDIKGHEKSVQYLSEGNRLRKRQSGYEIEDDTYLFESIKEAFAEPDAFPTSHAEPLKTGIPLFVVSMPRSGTTLVEQILSSHSDVFGGGEHDTLENAIQSLDWTDPDARGDVVSAIRQHYLSERPKQDGSRFVVDKSPINFRWIGFILAAFPEAKIIHTKRDARAVFWSIFKHYFPTDGNLYAYDPEDLLEYISLYRDLMAFWHEKFPGRVYDLSYEHLTEHQEVSTRALLEFVGLEWQESCLNFQDNTRSVRTASAMQVRQKMYQGSSEAWRDYEPFLKRFFDALA